MTFKKPFRAVPIKLGARYRAERRRKQLRSWLTAFTVLAASAAVGGAIGIAPTLLLPSTGNAMATTADTLSNCRVTDGDTIRCGKERIRLMGIDAPELPGHCRQGRACAPGDPNNSTDSLRASMQGRLTIQRYKQDRYGRTIATIATIAGNNGDLSCWQLKHRQAIYKPKWDEGGIVGKLCSAAID